MAKIKKQFTDTVEKDGKLYTEAAGPEEGKAGAKVVAEFEDTREDENGNLIVTGQDDGPEGFRANATVVQRYEKTEEGPDGNLHATGPAPDFAE